MPATWIEESCFVGLVRVTPERRGDQKRTKSKFTNRAGAYIKFMLKTRFMQFFYLSYTNRT
jgi:hypothetical protein